MIHVLLVQAEVQAHHDMDGCTYVGSSGGVATRGVKL